MVDSVIKYMYMRAIIKNWLGRDHFRCMQIDVVLVSDKQYRIEACMVSKSVWYGTQLFRKALCPVEGYRAVRIKKNWRERLYN